MVNFRMLSETEFRTGKSDYAKSLRAIYGDDGYQKYSAKINSIIVEGKEKTKKSGSTNPMTESLVARIAYLEAEYTRVQKLNAQNKRDAENFLKSLHGLIKITDLQEETLQLKNRKAFLSNIDESVLLSEKMEAYQDLAMYHNNGLDITS